MVVHIIHRYAHSNDDVLRMEKDTNVLSKWAFDWHMTFNLDKMYKN